MINRRRFLALATASALLPGIAHTFGACAVMA